MPRQPGCPQVGHWQELLDGTLPEDRHAPLQAHLETCPDCQRALEECAAGREAWAHAVCLRGGQTVREIAFRQALEKLQREIDNAALTEVSPAAWALDFLTPSGQPGCLGQLGRFDVREVIGRGGMGMVL